MTDKEIFDIQLAEAKDQLLHIDVSIKTTRTKVFYLIGISFTLLGFLSEDVYSGGFYSVKSIMFYPTLFVTTLILWKCRTSITPPKQRMNGIMPKLFQKHILTKENPEKAILNTYQISISTNGKILKQLSDNYKTAFIALIILGISLPFICVIASILTERFIT